MTRLTRVLCFAALALGLAVALPLSAQRQMENLGRGVVAMRTNPTDVFVSWRLLGYEPADLPFNLYRSAGGAPAVKLNPAPLTGGTNYTDGTANLAVTNAYFVRPILGGVELAASAAYTLPAAAPVQQFLTLPLQPAGDTYVHLVWVGDLDGDGEFDFVVSRMPNTSAPQQLDAYKRDGTFLWRVNFGPHSIDADNIEPPAAAINAGHNDGVTVYDLDGDGRAEVVIKSANGVVFGNGATLTYGDNVTQFISVLDGLTGAERARAPVPTDYLSDGPVAGHFGIAYLDGEKPSFIFKAKNRVGSGPFNLFIAAWDFDGTNLTQRWKWLRGNQDCPDDHQIRIVDVDRDGKDEICDGGYVLDDNGTLLYSLGPAGVIHGDRFHISDLDPDRPGLEGFGIQQNNASGLLYFIYDAATGAMIHRHFGGVEDTARGTAGDITTAHRGYEYWSFHGIHEIKTGTVLSPDPQRPWPNFRIWWDGDTLSENLNREIVEKWNPATGGMTRLLTASNFGAVDSWRDAAQFYGDILGDWREEVVYEKTDHSALLIFTTTTPTATRLYTLPHNPEYRLCFTVKGYLQSTMLDYYLGDGMAPPPAPNIVPVQSPATAVPVILTATNDTGSSASDRITADATPTLGGNAPAGAVLVVSQLGGADDGTTTADANGHWSFTYATPLAEGVHYFVARVDDGQNNFSWPFAVTLDTTAPEAPTIDAVVLDGAFTLTGTAEAGLPVDVSIDGLGALGSATANASGTWSFTTTGPALPPGSYVFRAVARDVAGNNSASAARTVDTTIPAPVIAALAIDTGISASDHITSHPGLTLQGTATPGATVNLYRFGLGAIGSAVADGSGAWSFDASATILPDGAYSFTAYTGTSAGSPEFDVIVDTTAPVVTASDRFSPASASGNASAITFRVAFNEAVTGVDAGDLTAVFGGGLTGMISTATAAGVNTFDVVVGSLSGEGTVRLDVNASGTGIADLAGNALPGGFTSGQTFTRVLLGNGVWLRTEPDGLWSDNANWQGGIVADGAGSSADFNTLDLTADNDVHLDSPRTLSALTFGDTTTASAASWLLDDYGNPANTLTLVAGTTSPTITVNALGTAARVDLGARLVGTVGLNKAGAGVLQLLGANTLTGTVGVNLGTLRVGTGGTFSPGTVNVSTGGSILHVAGGTLNATGTTNVTGSGSSVVVDSGSATFNAIAGNNNSGSVVRLNGGTVAINSVSFMRSTDSALNYATGFIVNGATATVGTITLGTNNSNAMMSVEGGALTVSGALTLGNQSTGGRGGHLRVTGGAFTSTDTAASGGMIVTRRNANASTVNLLGGVSTVEKFTLGFDGTVTSGSGTVNVNGGALYVGAGGFTTNATGTFAPSIVLANGTLGAKAAWSTSLPLALNSPGTGTLRAANAGGSPFDITLGGAITGTGGFTKTGAGTLTLGGTATYAGATNVSAGTLRVTGSLGATAVTVQSGATLAGTGTLGGNVSLQGGARLAFALGAGSPLAITGSLQRVSAGNIGLDLTALATPTTGSTVTLATFAATNLTANDLTVALPAGVLGVPQLESNALKFVVTGVGPTAEFTHWAYLAGLTAGNNGANDDPDGDGVNNLLEFVLARDPLLADATALTPVTVAVSGTDYPAVSFPRRLALGGVTTAIDAASNLAWSPLIPTTTHSATDQGDGTELVVVRSTQPLAAEPRQFFHLSATLP